MRTKRAPKLLLDPPRLMSLYLSREEIAETVRRLAAEISRDYAGKRPLLLCVLKGAFIFLALPVTPKLKLTDKGLVAAEMARLLKPVPV